MRAAIWKLKQLKQSTSHLWIVIKKEIIAFGLVTLITTCLIPNKPFFRPENSCNKEEMVQDNISGQEYFVLTQYFDFCPKF